MIDDTYLTVGSGFFDTATQVIELHKVQSVEYKQNFFQKRRKVASIAAATSSKALNLVHLNEELAKSLVNFMLFKIESQNRDWM